MFNASDGFEDALWESASRTPPPECLLVNPKNLDPNGSEPETIRDCGNKECAVCTQVRHKRMEDTEEMGDLTPQELDDIVNDWLENPQDPLAIPVLFDDEKLTLMDCRESFSDLIGESFAGDQDPEEVPGWFDHFDHQIAPPATPSKEMAGIDAILANSFAQEEPNWDAMQAEYEKMISQYSDGGLVNVNEPQIGLAEIQEAHEVEYVRPGKAQIVQVDDGSTTASSSEGSD